jgi:hypothetical protein
MARFGRSFPVPRRNPLIRRFLPPVRHVTFTLKDHTNTAVATTTVDLGLFSYGSATVSDPAWMVLEQKSSPTTDGSGNIDITYITGSAAVGDTLYVVVNQPSGSPAESFVWTTTVLGVTQPAPS